MFGEEENESQPLFNDPTTGNPLFNKLFNLNMLNIETKKQMP